MDERDFVRSDYLTDFSWIFDTETDRDNSSG